MSDEIYAVFGVTGAQGSRVAHHLLEAGKKVRGLTRNPNSEKAKKLDSRMEVVECNLDDEKLIENALKGVHGVFLMTNFWEHFQPEKEVEQVQRVAKLAKKAGVKHLVFSTLEDTSRLDAPEINGFKVPHFDSKARASKWLDELDGLNVTHLYTSFFYENFINFGMAPKVNGAPDGIYRLALNMGEKLLPMVSVDDIGKAGAALLLKGPSVKSAGIASAHLTGKDIVDVFSKITGKPCEYAPMTRKEYAALGFPGADDLANMFQFKHDFNDEFCRLRSLDKSKELIGELKDFSAWLKENVDALENAMKS